MTDQRCPAISLLAVGVGVPGVVNEDTGVVVVARTSPGGTTFREEILRMPSAHRCSSTTT
jgi:hypothetical protein